MATSWWRRCTPAWRTRPRSRTATTSRTAIWVRPKTGIGTWFDFIIVHESAHEWFGNSITARDRSDMWIHEGWANYCESRFSSSTCGAKRTALTYINTGKENVKNAEPVISEEGISHAARRSIQEGRAVPQHVRSVSNDDAEWFTLLHDYYQHFKYQTIMTTDMVAFFNATHRAQSDADLQRVPSPCRDSHAGASI